MTTTNATTISARSTWATLNTLTGGLSAPGKMPGPAWNISALDCKMGAILRNVPGSTCGGCYALKGRYVWPATGKAQARRLAAFNADPAAWAQAMAASVSKHKLGAWFRWFDAGDLQSVTMLEAIVTVARLVPATAFWLPTRERGMIRTWLKANPGGFPANLTVRISAPMVGGTVKPIAGTVSSTVQREDIPVGESRCGAGDRGGKCADCRACWSFAHAVIAYPMH